MKNPIKIKKKQKWLLQDRYSYQGFPISIENKKGSFRRGQDKDGHKWKTFMHYDYGYIRNTEATDGEAVDVYVNKKSKGKKIPYHSDCGKLVDQDVYVVHQKKIEHSGKWHNGICPDCSKHNTQCNCPQHYDEDKVMMGFDNKKVAISAYLKQYDSPRFLGPVSTFTLPEFKTALSQSFGKKLPSRESKHEHWVGVDLDGTLAKDDGWKGVDHIGEPVKKMRNRIGAMLKRGERVKIFTARAYDKKAIPPIKAWLRTNGFPDLEITNIKDPGMINLYDDRAIRVRKNTGGLMKSFYVDLDKSMLGTSESSGSPGVMHSMMRENFVDDPKRKKKKVIVKAPIGPLPKEKLKYVADKFGVELDEETDLEKAFVKETTYTSKKTGKTIHRKAYIDSRKKKIAVVRHKKMTRVDYGKEDANKKIEAINKKKDHHHLHIESAEDMRAKVEAHKRSGNKTYKIGKKDHHIDKVLTDLNDHIEHHTNENKSHDNHIKKIEDRYRTEAKHWDKVRAKKKVKAKIKSDSKVDSKPKKSGVIDEMLKDGHHEGEKFDDDLIGVLEGMKGGTETIESLTNEIKGLNSRNNDLADSMKELSRAHNFQSKEGEKGHGEWLRAQSESLEIRKQINKKRDKISAIKEKNGPTDEQLDATAKRERESKMAERERNITSTTYERAQKRLNKDHDNFFRGEARGGLLPGRTPKKVVAKKPIAGLKNITQKEHKKLREQIIRSNGKIFNGKTFIEDGISKGNTFETVRMKDEAGKKKLEKQLKEMPFRDKMDGKAKDLIKKIDKGVYRNEYRMVHSGDSTRFNELSYAQYKYGNNLLARNVKKTEGKKQGNDTRSESMKGNKNAWKGGPKEIVKLGKFTDEQQELIKSAPIRIIFKERPKDVPEDHIVMRTTRPLNHGEHGKSWRESDGSGPFLVSISPEVTDQHSERFTTSDIKNNLELDAHVVLYIPKENIKDLALSQMQLKMPKYYEKTLALVNSGKYNDKSLMDSLFNGFKDKTTVESAQEHYGNLVDNINKSTVRTTKKVVVPKEKIITSKPLFPGDRGYIEHKKTFYVGDEGADRRFGITDMSKYISNKNYDKKTEDEKMKMHDAKGRYKVGSLAGTKTHRFKTEEEAMNWAKDLTKKMRPNAKDQNIHYVEFVDRKWQKANPSEPKKAVVSKRGDTLSKIKTKTKTGINVELTAKGYDVFVGADIPKLGGKINFKADGYRKDRDGREAVFGNTRHKGKTIPIGLSIPAADYNKIKDIVDKKKEGDVRKAKSLNIEWLKYETGADYPSKHDLVYEVNSIPYEAMKERHKNDAELIDALKELSLDELGDEMGAKKIEPTMSTYGGYRFNKEQFEQLRDKALKKQKEKPKVTVNPKYSKYTDAELKKEEKEYDDIHNEGGEGYNPYRDDYYIS